MWNLKCWNSFARRLDKASKTSAPFVITSIDNFSLLTFLVYWGIPYNFVNKEKYKKIPFYINIFLTLGTLPYEPPPILNMYILLLQIIFFTIILGTSWFSPRNCSDVWTFIQQRNQSNKGGKQFYKFPLHFICRDEKKGKLFIL